MCSQASMNSGMIVHEQAELSASIASMAVLAFLPKAFAYWHVIALLLIVACRLQVPMLPASLRLIYGEGSPLSHLR